MLERRMALLTWRDALLPILALLTLAAATCGLTSLTDSDTAVRRSVVPAKRALAQEPPAVVVEPEPDPVQEAEPPKRRRWSLDLRSLVPNRPNASRRDLRRYVEDLLTGLAAAECSVCPSDEQAAVVAVALTRARRSGKGLESVVLARGQFADIGSRWSNDKTRRRVLPAVKAAMNGDASVWGATHFHAKWICQKKKNSRCDGQDRLWPTLEEVQVPEDWKHRFFQPAYLAVR